mgnify:FL=1
MSYIDKPRFHKPTHPARAKPVPEDPGLEPSTALRLPFLRSDHVPSDAPPLQAHAQAGIEMQRRAMDDVRERDRQQTEQLEILTRAKAQLRKELPLCGVRCAAAACSSLAHHPDVREHVFRSRRSKHIQPDPQGDAAIRVLQLSLPQDERVPQALMAAVQASNGTLIPHPVVFDWDYWNVDQILRALLPDALEELSLIHI